MEKSVEVLTADLAESSTTQDGYAGPTTGTERILAEVLADVVRVEQVSVDSHFFDDLGADSMVMALFCARVRKRAGPAVGVDEGHLPAPDDQKPGGGARGRRAHARVEPSVAPPASTEVATPASTRAVRPLRSAAVPDLPRICLPRRTCQHPRLRVDLRRLRCDRHLPAVGPGRRRDLPRHVHPSDPGEVDAHRSVEAPADPHLEPGVRPLLDRQDAGPVEPAGPPDRRFAALRALSAGRWARKSGEASRSSPSTCPCAPTCSPSATARSSARTRSSAATGPTPA